MTKITGNPYFVGFTPSNEVNTIGAVSNRSAINITRISNCPLSLSSNKIPTGRLLIKFRKDTVSKSNMEKLIGMSVSSKVAEKTMHAVTYSGLGVIEGYTKSLSRVDYNLLVENSIRPLFQSPITNTAEKVRTPAECLIDIGSTIKNTPLSPLAKDSLLNRIKNNYLTSKVSTQTLNDLRDIIKLTLNDKLNVEMNIIINSLIDSVEKNFYITKHNDNYYGRFFESAFSRYIVDNPSIEMLQVKESILNEIQLDFERYSIKEKKILCKSIASLLELDRTAWHTENREIENFIKTKTPENFLTMLMKNNKVAHLLTLQVAVKYIIVAPGYENLKKTASTVYSKVILAQRNLAAVYSNRTRSNRTGILLNYQNADSMATSNGTGSRPIDQYRLSTRNISSHDQDALEHERPIGIGMSGCSNILNFLFLNIKLKNDDFDLTLARLMTAAYLTFSGGHSINEAFTVFGYQNNQNFQPLSFDMLGTHNDLAKKAIDHAYDKLLDMASKLNR